MTASDEGMKFAFVIAAIEESPYWDSLTEEAAEARWDEWIARVRRDAAREALDGLIADKAHMAALLYAENGGNVEDVLTHYRNSIHPEETP